MYYTNHQLSTIRINLEETKCHAMYEEKLSRFSDYDKSILWQCFNDKIDKDLHTSLNEVIKKSITSDVPVELYRGVSDSTLKWLNYKEIGDIISDDRVLSFSSDFSVARQFAGSYVYGTRTILSIRNCPFAFNYQEHAFNLILAAPDSEFLKDKRLNAFAARGDALDMINREDEWMFPIGTKFEVIEIEDLQYDSLSPSYRIYHLDFISF